MEWLKAILEGDSENKLEEIKKELPKNFIPKEKFNEQADKLKAKEEELDTVNTKMSELSTQVENLSKSEEEKDKLKEQIEKVNSDFETFKSEADSRVANIQKRQAIERGLRDAQANPDTIDLLIEKFDLSTIELGENDTVKDWDTHLTPIKEQRKSLFGESTLSGTKPPSGGDPQISNYKAKYEEALKSNDRLTAIKIKQEAFSNGEVI